MAQRQRELADTGKVTAVASANDADPGFFTDDAASFGCRQLAEKAQANARSSGHWWGIDCALAQASGGR